MDRLHHYNHEQYPLGFLATDFPETFKIDDRSISLRVIDQNRKPHKVCSTQGLTKSAGQEIRHNLGPVYMDKSCPG